MTLYRQAALEQALMANLLGEIVDFFILADSDTNVADIREDFINRIGDVLDFDETYLNRAIRGEITKEELYNS